MRKPRKRRRRGEDGSGAASLLLPGFGTLLCLLPLLLLPISAVAVAFSRSAFSADVGSRASTPAAVVVRTAAASPPPPVSPAFSSASAPPPMRPPPSSSGELPKYSAPILCDGCVEQNKRVGGGTGRGTTGFVPFLPANTITVAPDGGCPYHDWDLFSADFEEMMKTVKIFVYPDARDVLSPFSGVFLPHPDPYNAKLGNYHSEHMFKHALLNSPLLAPDPSQAHLFFLPLSINALRNDPRVRSEAAIADFVARYADQVTKGFSFWNASGGVDHFYVSCHSVGRNAAAGHHELRDNAVHVSCTSSYFQRNYVAHKDVALPQVWPRPPERSLNPPGARKRLVFFAGRIQNSQVRAELILKWENDSSMDIFSSNPPFPYEEGFRRSRYCLHVKGYEVNTARISDAIHYGCIPVILSNYYDLPFANVLDWNKFSVIINHRDISLLKGILLSITDGMYLTMYQNLMKVRKHFRWHTTPERYDAFHMTVYQVWLKRFSHLGFVS